MVNLSVDIDNTIATDPELMALVEEVGNQLQQGRLVDFDKLTRDFPAQASELKELLPAIATLVSMGDAHSKSQREIPEQFGKYRLLAKLGTGGMGHVYMAQHTELQKTVAIKVLREERNLDPQSAARFQQEIKAIGKLDHPNIVRATDAGEEQGIRFLIMEYVHGIDLGELGRQVPEISVTDACEMCRQAAEGIAFMHRAGFIHRDIKPSNLFLTKDGQIKVLDFGLARLIEAECSESSMLTQTGHLIGTINYMAPEQAENSREVDGRADIYSLGATLYHMLTGAAPFVVDKSSSPLKTMLAIATLPVSPIRSKRPEVPPELEAIVSRALAKNPGERIATAEDVALALEPFASGSDLRKLAAGLESTAGPSEPLKALTAALDVKREDTASAPASEKLRSCFFDGTLVRGNVAPRLHARDVVAQPSLWQRRSFLIALSAAAIVSLLAGAIIVRDKYDKIKSITILEEGDKVEISQAPVDQLAGEAASQRHGVPVVAAGAKGAGGFALSFDGEDDFVDVPRLIYNGKQPITIELFATPKSEHSFQQLVLISNFDYKDDGQDFGISLFQRGDTYPSPTYASWAMSYSGQKMSSQSLIAPAEFWKPNQRAHIAFVAVGPVFRFFVDGKLWRHGKLTNPPAASKTAFSIGGHKLLNGFFGGEIDEIRVSKSARYSDNFTPATRHEPDKNTLALFHCDEGQGETLTDSSGNKFDGVIRGATWTRRD